MISEHEEETIKKVYYKTTNEEGRASFIEYNGRNPERMKEDLEKVGYTVKEISRNELSKRLPGIIL